jgi:hypothetical protein
MFEGSRECSLCKKALSGNEKNFGKSLLGYSHSFCDQCFRERKADIKKLLSDERH